MGVAGLGAATTTPFTRRGKRSPSDVENEDDIWPQCRWFGCNIMPGKKSLTRVMNKRIPQEECGQ